jgi:hypothetical protein
MYKIDKKYRIPIEEISCPGCGRRYGHNRTKVDTISQECSSCVKQFGYKEFNLVDSTDYIENFLNIKPFIWI